MLYHNSQKSLIKSNKSFQIPRVCTCCGCRDKIQNRSNIHLVTLSFVFITTFLLHSYQLKKIPKFHSLFAQQSVQNSLRLLLAIELSCCVTVQQSDAPINLCWNITKSGCHFTASDQRVNVSGVTVNAFKATEYQIVHLTSIQNYLHITRQQQNSCVHGYLVLVSFRIGLVQLQRLSPTTTR